MRAHLFLFFYGILTFTGMFLAVFWTKVSVRRAKQINDRWLLRQDRYFILSCAIALVSGGTAMVDGARVLGNIIYGLSPILQHDVAYMIAFGLLVVWFGTVLLVLLADLEKIPPDYMWLKAMALVTVVWLLATVAIAPKVPYYPPHEQAVHHP